MLSPEDFIVLIQLLMSVSELFPCKGISKCITCFGLFDFSSSCLQSRSSNGLPLSHLIITNCNPQFTSFLVETYIKPLPQCNVLPVFHSEFRTSLMQCLSAAIVFFVCQHSKILNLIKRYIVYLWEGGLCYPFLFVCLFCLFKYDQISLHLFVLQDCGVCL